ncbi:MAG: GNAT family N-acetyltransferase [Dehalococcoidia bacterium]|nr:GNAT family N-acetyltransferase [Dehalococcoidia bacterium]
MRPPSVRPFQAADLPACAARLAEGHRVARTRQHALPPRFEDAEACGALIEKALEGQSDAWVAERDGRVVGYLAGTRSLQSPDSFGAQYAPPHSVSVSLAGHALATDEPRETYRSLYAAASRQWAEDGFFVHRVSLRPADTEAREAWFLLGFGANTTFSTRTTAPIDGGVDPASADVEVHAASLEELPVVRHFDELESLHHRDAPIFWPHLGRDVASSVEAFQRAALEGERNPIFIATREGEPLAMHFVIRSGGFGGPMSQPDGSIYLYQAIVEPQAQGNGVGTVLLRHTVDWARAEGFGWINLHYASMNPTGAPFWQRHGFEGVEMSVGRTLDDRIAWARGR